MAHSWQANSTLGEVALRVGGCSSQRDPDRLWGRGLSPPAPAAFVHDVGRFIDPPDGGDDVDMLTYLPVGVQKNTDLSDQKHKH